MNQATEIAYPERIDAIRKTLGNSPQAQQAFFQHAMNDPELRQLGERLQLAQIGVPYFGGSISTDGLLDFLIWKHEADRLGIKLTRGDVSKEVARLTFNLFAQNEPMPSNWPKPKSPREEPPRGIRPLWNAR